MEPQCSVFKDAFKAKGFFTPWHPHDSSEHCLPGGGSVSIKGQEETGVMPQGQRHTMLLQFPQAPQSTMEDSVNWGTAGIYIKHCHSSR